MKKILIMSVAGFVAFFFSLNSQAQSNKSGGELTYVNASAKLTKTHTRAELEAMGKLDLTKIYQERIAIITELVPYLALHSKPGATLTEMGIPKTKENVAHLEKEVANKTEYLGSVNQTLTDVIPYADKENIIWSILFFEEMIQRASYHNAEPVNNNSNQGTGGTQPSTTPAPTTGN
ncbi:MAG: hypothetical protein U0U66_06975 [Cytophagaceae bacterium]